MSRTNPRFIDLHCHPQGKAFNFLRNSKDFGKKDYHPWMVILSNFRHQKKGKRAFSYAQCDMAKLWNGDGAVIFASLYPFEKGFFSGGGRIDKNGVNKIVSTLDKAEGVSAFLFKQAVRPLLSSEEGVTSAKDHFQSMLMRMPLKRVNFIQSSGYDYYEELQEEYRFLVKKHQVTSSTKVHGTAWQRLKWKLFPRKNAKDSTQATGTYAITKNFSEVETALNEKKVAFILTIEGMHSLGTDTHLPELMKRIEAIKQWEYPVFFITFAHHFNNFLCGHAHSIPREATLFVDQTQGMQGSFNAMGWAALRYLLSLDPNNTKNTQALGRRILIDVKHMGVTSRKEYYQQVVRPCLANGDVIPVIASHVGYTGVSTLADLEKNFNDGKETEEFQVVKGLNPWHINVCNEDIEVIVKTRGLLGLCLDQRIMGLRKKEHTSSADLAWHNIKGILDAVVNSPNLQPTEKPHVWDVLCLGTDFEGYIDPADTYATALEFDAFEKDLTLKIQTELIDKNLSQTYFIQVTAGELARNMCMGNVMQFLKLHF